MVGGAIRHSNRTRSQIWLNGIHKRSTAGNALYAKEFLLSLKHLGLLQYHFWIDEMVELDDIQQILSETVAARNVVSILTKRMVNLPPADQAILPRIASIGSTFTYHMFQVVVEDILRVGVPCSILATTTQWLKPFWIILKWRAC